MRITTRDLVLLLLMVVVALTAELIRPKVFIADQSPEVNLETLIPKQFGKWIELQQSIGQIVNPQQVAKLQEIYSQTLSRSYIRNDGTVVMLSISYGKNQSDGVALHYPEICYPSQGFQLISSSNNLLNTNFKDIPIKHLLTKLGNRIEPVTYWSTLGNKVVEKGLQTKLAQLEYGFTGRIPDGLLFRVSTTSTQPATAYEIHAEFTRALLSEIPKESRNHLIGAH